MTAEGLTPFTLEAGSLVGEGVVVFEAANGDLLVGIMTWDVGAAVDGERITSIHFSWRDSVEFIDGTVVANTGTSSVGLAYRIMKQEENLLLNIGCQIQQVHDLLQPGPTHVPQAGQVGAVPNLVVPDQLLESPVLGRLSTWLPHLDFGPKNLLPHPE